MAHVCFSSLIRLKDPKFRVDDLVFRLVVMLCTMAACSVRLGLKGKDCRSSNLTVELILHYFVGSYSTLINSTPSTVIKK